MVDSHRTVSSFDTQDRIDILCHLQKNKQDMKKQSFQIFKAHGVYEETLWLTQQDLKVGSVLYFILMKQ